jgi:hypothetical protein
MFKPDETTTTTISTTGAESEALTQATEAQSASVVASTARGSTKDAGRVHVGGGMMRF